MDSTQLKQLITFVLWRMEVNLNGDERLSQKEHTPKRKGAKYNRPEAIDLILGTACVESDCGHFIKQIGGGPARGIFQMERMTHDDIWHKYINHRPELKAFMRGELPQTTVGCKFDNLEYSLRYAIMMTRLHYYRVSESIPNNFIPELNLRALWPLAIYWKTHYNTRLGEGTEDEFVKKWKQYT